MSMEILPCGVAVISTDTHHKKWVQETGRLVHDEWFAGEICKHIKPGDVVVDGGANIGTLTQAMLNAGATVIAFEPNQDARECLEYNCGIRSWLSALSDKSGQANLRQDTNAGATYCEQTEEWGMVPTVTLDSLKLSACALLKADIEGYEAKALRGARETIARCKPVLIVEVNNVALERAGDSRDGLLELIESYGYTWKILQPECKREDAQYDVECEPK